MLSPFISQKFKFWSFVSMVLLVFVHGYNLELRYLQPWTTPEEQLTFTSFTEYFLANGIFRFRIPMLFIISGYLYAMHDQVPNKQRVGKRFKTLIIPYFLWSAFGIAITYLLELFPYGNHLVESSQVVQIDESRKLIHEYYWYEVLGRWVFFPVSYQLWFIRVLFIYNLAYPAIRWCVLHPTAKWIFFSVAVLLWLSTFGLIFFEGEGLLFFSIGVWMHKTNFNIETPSAFLKPFQWLILFLLLASVKTFLAFKGFELIADAVYPVLILFHKATILSGLIACWFGFDAIVKWCMNKQWFIWLSAFSFIIYAMHAPVVAFLINGMFEGLNYMEGYRLISFVGLPLLVITGCIVTGVILRFVSPKMYGVLTGGRGL